MYSNPPMDYAYHTLSSHQWSIPPTYPSPTPTPSFPSFPWELFTPYYTHGSSSPKYYLNHGYSPHTPTSYPPPPNSYASYSSSPYSYDHNNYHKPIQPTNTSSINGHQYQTLFKIKRDSDKSLHVIHPSFKNHSKNKSASPCFEKTNLAMFSQRARTTKRSSFSFKLRTVYGNYFNQQQSSDRNSPLSSSFNPISHTTINVTALVADSQNLTVLASSVLPQTNLSLRPEPQMLDSKTEPPDNNYLTMDSSNEDHEIVELDSVELLAEHLHFCEICGKGFKRDTNLRMHMQAHENKFKTLEALAKPLDYGSTHRSLRRFSCLFEDDDDEQQHEEIDSSFTHNYRVNSDDIVPSYDFEPIRSLPDFSPNLVSSFEREFLSELVVRVTQSPSSSESAVIHGLKCLSPLLINSHSVHWANVSLLFNVLLVFITDSRYKVREQSLLFLRDVLISFQTSSLLASASEGVQIILDRFLLLSRGATANAGKETTGAKQVLYILDALKECFPLFSLTYKTSILKQFNSFLVLHQPLVIKHITNCLNFLFLNPESEVSPEALLEVLCSLSTLSTLSNMMPGDGITFNARLLDAGIQKVFSLIRQMCVISVFNDFKAIFASEHEEVIFAAADAPEKTLTVVNTYLSKPSEYTTSTRKAGDAQARDNLERVLDCLDRDKRETFEDCVTWARLKFEDYFANWEKQLAFTFPEDSATCTGAPFWSAPKIFSRSLQSSTSDLIHLHFVMAAAILHPETFGITIPDWVKNSRKVADAVDRVIVPDFHPKEGVKVVMDEKATSLSATSIALRNFDAYASSAKQIEELVTFYNWCTDVVFRFSNAKELAVFFIVTFELMSPNHITYPAFPTQKVILEAEGHSEFLQLDSYIFRDQIFKKVICSSHATVLMLDTHYGSNISGWILIVMVVPFKQWDPE